MNFGPSSENAQIADSTSGNAPGEPEIVYFSAVEQHGDAKESAEPFSTFTTQDQAAEKQSQAALKRTNANDSGDLTEEQVPPSADSNSLNRTTTQNSAPEIESPAGEGSPTVQFMGVREFAMQPEYPSPDGNYTAQVQLNEQGLLQIVIVNQANEPVFTSAEMSVAAISGVRWNEESTKLEYQVMFSEESTAQFVVNLAD